ncbi:MAG: hypothetical protein ACUZ77_06450 [Candidatus Brocadiales bacterium]
MRQQRLIVVLILLLLTPCLVIVSEANLMAVHADTIKLKNLREDIEAKITELTQDYISVVISKNSIKSVAIQPNNRQVYPDLVSFFTSRAKLECKVSSINPGSIGIKIPRSEVISVHMVFAPEVAKRKKQGKASALNRQRAPIFSPPTKEAEPVFGPDEGIETYVPTPVRRPPVLAQEFRKEAGMYAVEPPFSREVAKEKIKRDVMRELEMDEVWPNTQVLKDEIKRELKEEFEAKREAEEKIFQETELGRVEGVMLRKNRPLQDCEIRIVMLVKSKIPFSQSFKQPELPTEYDGITDSEGRYHLMNVAPGEYKIYWKPPMESGWIRRIRMRPDITVVGGKTTYPKDIETLKRIIN